MTGNKAGGLSLIGGAVLAMLVFATHPSHAGGAPLVGPFTLSQLVHAVALAAVPLLTLGMWQMAEWLGLDRPLVRLGLVLSAFAMVLTAVAAVVSSFATPAAARASMAQMESAHRPASPSHAVPRAHPAPRQLPPLVAYSVALNRGFAQVHVAFLSLAILLFGLAMRGHSLGLAATGMLVGAGPLLWQLSGRFSPETTTMPWVIFPQSLWLIAMAATMLRRQPPAED